MNQNPNNPYESTSYGSGQPGQNNPGYPYDQPGQNNPSNPYDQYPQTQQAGPGGNYPPQYPQQNPNPYPPNPYEAGAASNPYAYPAAPPPPAPPAYNQAGPVSQPDAFAPYGQGGGMQPPPQKPRTGNGLRIGLIALVVVLVLAGIVAAVAIPIHNTQVANSNATATAQTVSTATARANATATAQAMATATAIASTYPFSANLKLNDPLTDNSKGVNWKTDSSCSFSGGAYHASDTSNNSYYTCPALNSNFSDFTYQVTMQFNKGNNVDAGLTFRGDENSGKKYGFIFSPTGGYDLLAYSSNNANSTTTLQSGNASSAGFKTGTGQSNDIGVVAQGSSIAVYVNGQKLATATSSTYSSGQIGVIAYNLGDTVDASFTNSKVWALS